MKKNIYTYILFFIVLWQATSNTSLVFASRITETANNYKSKNSSIKILSWNIQDLGGSKSDEIILKIAKLIKKSDLVIIQEVVAKDPRGARAVARIVAELNRMGNTWDYLVSAPTRSPSAYMSERYAYLWKKSKLSLLKSAFLYEQLKNVCVREPYIAEFKIKNSELSFYSINCHSRRFNQNPQEEVKYFINYPQRLRANNIILAGDFNLDEKHTVWRDFYQKGYVAAVKNTPTTLKLQCENGKYRNHAIDNIYVKMQDFTIHNASVIDFVQDCEKLEKRRKISDHLPVVVELTYTL